MMASLLAAAEAGDVNEVRSLLQYNKHPFSDALGRTALHHACLNGHVSVVRVLASEFKVNVSDNYDCTPLHCACENGYIVVVRALVSEFKADLNIKDLRGFTPLHLACKKGYCNIVGVLVSEFEADLSIPDAAGCTPLMLAARGGHEDVVLALLRDYQCPVTDRDSKGWRVLHHACAGGSVMIVQILVDEYKADVTDFYYNNETPLFVALNHQCIDVAFCLICKYGCNPNVASSHGITALHYACQSGDVNLVQALINEHKANVNALNYKKETPLVVALNRQNIDVVFCLICEFGCDPNVVNFLGKTPLHYACELGDINIVKALIEHKANINAYSELVGTPLHVACRARKYEVLLSLMSDPSCDPYMKDQDGRTVLHLACESDYIDLVNTLLHTLKMDVNAYNVNKETPLHVALASNQHKVALALVKEHGCDTNVVDSYGQTPLQYVCQNGGDLDLVQALIHEYKGDVNAYSRLVHVAFRARKYEILLSLISDPRCDPYMKDNDGQTMLHLACNIGNLALVNALVCTHKMDVNVLNMLKETPLQIAFASNQHKVALALVKEHGCDTTTLDKNGWTLLHWACKQGAIELVHALISDIEVCTDQNDTPLHLAARVGHYDVVLALVSDARCDPNARNNLERTALHIAAYYGHHKILQELLKFSSPLVVDKFGNTPLHLAASSYKIKTVQFLLHGNAPVLVRNADGSTPKDLAWGKCESILEEYIRVNHKQLKGHYSTILKLAEKKYSGSHWITRIFVVGNPGAGKSSFIEALKRESFFKSFSKVSESSVPPHTAGIIPSVHMSSQYGRVLFYDFAGDVEYYSSHVAIFESLASSRKGDNIFIVVVDLREDSETIKTTLHYWFYFIQYQKFNQSSFIIVGGHLDQSVEQSGYLEFCSAMQPNVHNIKHFMLDCRDPRSSQIAQVKKQISTWVCESQKYRLSREARLLLVLLEKDFSAVTACPVQTLVSHIKDCGGWLPVEPKPLHQILLELHEVGVLLLLGDCTKDTDHVILNISKLTNEVHEALFSTSAFSNIQGTCSHLNFNIGVLPDSILNDVLPQYISKECLIHLQYCQEIRHRDASLFPSLKLNDSTNQSFLFFPALCCADKGQVSWDESTGHSFSIRWLALCTDLHDYFPPRFLHVLLLRLVHRFTLSVPEQLLTAHASPEHSRRCTMWKKGVYWKKEEGVDCMVELVKGNKGVVVLSKSSQDGAENCVKVFTKMMSCVMEAKAEFCHSIKPGFFFLDSSAEADYLNEDHQFAMSDVEKALWSSEEKRVVISVLGEREMDLSNFQWMRSFSYWNTFFPITSYEVLHTLEMVVDKIFELGLSLGASWSFLESLWAEFPSDVNRRIRIVSWWMKSSSTPPCWYTLVDTLRDIGRSDLAETLQVNHGVHIQLQEKILSEETQALKPDEDFLRSLSGVVGSRWPSLAVCLALTEREIEELKGKVPLSQEVLALQMLKIWSSKEDATYGQLFHQFKTISLFQYSS